MAAAEREQITLAYMTEDALGFTIELLLEYRIHDDEWLGVCEQLGVEANAATLEETKELLEELVQLQLKGVEGLMDLREYLAERGVTLIEPESSVV